MKIKIVRTPPGQAPLWVRQDWVGLVMPVDEEATKGNHFTQRGVLGGPPKNLGGYSILTSIALSVLNEKHPKTAKWFWEKSRLGTHLVFSREVCEVIK